MKNSEVDNLYKKHLQENSIVFKNKKSAKKYKQGFYTGYNLIRSKLNDRKFIKDIYDSHVYWDSPDRPKLYCELIANSASKAMEAGFTTTSENVNNIA